MSITEYAKYLLAMAGVTYLLRTIPFILLKKNIESPFWKSFLAYIPYTVLSAMTIPAIFYTTNSKISAAAALITAIGVSLLGRGLVLVAIAACAAVLCVDGAFLVF
ncbi:MAG: AzlD domain-containing protein [Fibrobacteraceae bacterium]|nr:AzlD domain-containing protein [Fibrobacteraceae bacterium]